MKNRNEIQGEPAAWLGYTPHPKQFVTVRICTPCDDADGGRARRLASGMGFRVTDTYCVACHQKAMAAAISA